MSLAARLQAGGEASVAAQLAHPVVAGLGRGDLDPARFRGWLEQDFLFLQAYVRVFARLAWQAPAHRVADLVDLAHATAHDELALHRELAAPFGADLDAAVAAPQCAAYTGFLLDAAASYGRGLAALLPCMWGYSRLGQELARVAPVPGADPRYRRWVEDYASEEFAALARRCAAMLDEAAAAGAVTEEAAAEAFRAGLDHELAFWDAA